MGDDYEPGPNSEFFRVVDTTRNDFLFHRKKLQCIDRKKLNLYGNYNSELANQLSIIVRRCVNLTEEKLEKLTPDDPPPIICKSDEEITEWLRNKYILLYYNEVIFNATRYNDQAVAKVSQVKWIKVST